MVRADESNVFLRVHYVGAFQDQLEAARERDLRLIEF